MDSEFLFERSSIEGEVRLALDGSAPVRAKEIRILKTESDFDLGEFKFVMRGRKEFYFPLHNKYHGNINRFWIFLEDISKFNASLLFFIFYAGQEFIIYSAPFDNTNIRFTIMDTRRLYDLERRHGILSYSYAECDIDIDIIIKKRTLIKSFYNALFELFNKYSAIAYFEPPYIDFNYWTKDSIIIKNYLRKNRGLRKTQKGVLISRKGIEEKPKKKRRQKYYKLGGIYFTKSQIKEFEIEPLENTKEIYYSIPPTEDEIMAVEKEMKNNPDIIWNE